MQFSTLTISSLFAVLAAATTETVSIESLFIRDNNGIQNAAFELQPANVACTGSAPDLDNYGVVACGESKYRFAINGSDSEYTVRIYKELATAYGLYGESATLPVYCRAGGNGIDDRVCDQVGDAEVVIDDVPDA